MSCFGGGSRSRPWRWWRIKCAGVAASVGSRLCRSIKGLDGRRRRRRATSSSSVMMHRSRQSQYSSFAPVYVDELYTHHNHQPSGGKPPLKLNAAVAVQEEPGTSGGKLVAAADATRASGSKATARVAAATATAAGARAGGKPRASAAAAGVGAMKNILLRSPGRGGGVLGVVKGMGEVDLRAELFIRRFKEDMRLQSQRSAEEFQAMLARGL